MVNNQLVELFAAELFDELEAVELDEGADADAAARFAFAKSREAKGFGQASTYQSEWYMRCVTDLLHVNHNNS